MLVCEAKSHYSVEEDDPMRLMGTGRPLAEAMLKVMTSCLGVNYSMGSFLSLAGNTWIFP